MPIEILVGVDAGATKTEAIAIGVDGTYIGSGRSGPSNPASVGVEISCINICESIVSSIRGRRAEEITLIGIGLAGWAGGVWDRDLISCISNRIGVSRDSISIAEDIDVAHYSAFLGGEGVVAILGTGSNFLGKAGGRVIRVGGLGHILGDEGSGWRIGLLGLQMVFKSIDGRIGPTTLVTKAYKHYRVDSHKELLRIIYSSKDIKSLIASFASEVFQAAKEGDKTAIEILRQEAREIALAYRAIVENIGSQMLAIVGSTYKMNKDIWAPIIREAIAEVTGKIVEIIEPMIKQPCASIMLALNRKSRKINLERIPPECVQPQDP